MYNISAVIRTQQES